MRDPAVSLEALATNAVRPADGAGRPEDDRPRHAVRAVRERRELAGGVPMLVPISSGPGAARLRNLLLRATDLDEIVEAARSLPPALSTQVVVTILKAQLTCPMPPARAIRAAHLVHALGLTDAVPILVRCVEQLPETEPVRDAALSALSRLGSGASEALLSAIDRSTSVPARMSFAEVLAAAPGTDERIRAALVRMLEYAPAHAARLLGRRGEWKALPDVRRALDRLAIAPIADCPVCAWEDLLVLAATIRSFGAELSEEQEASIDDARDAVDGALAHTKGPLDAAALSRVPVRRTRRPGRNDQCPCGSGKKYKHCHLRADELETTH